MSFRVALLSAAFALCTFSVSAAEAPVKPADHPEFPWIKDSEFAEKVVLDIQKSGFDGVGPHVADIENVLAGARHAFEIAAAGDKDGTYVLTTDERGPALAPVQPDPKRKAYTAFNPYIELSFFLGTYYDKHGKPEDGLRVLDLGLSLPGTDKDSHRGDLLIERGAALAALHRWPESLAAYDDALRVPDTDVALQAYINRGRGMALYEMGRKPEARDAYLTSLKLVANNKDAKKALEFIEQSRDGGPKMPPSMHVFQVPADSQPQDQKPADNATAPAKPKE
jgi:tetratricopeptide (TPR) repeat protein